MPPGVHRFKVQVSDALEMQDSRSLTIFVNRDLRADWPETLALRTGTDPLPKSSSPIYSDLDADGRQEIVVVDENTILLSAGGVVR